MCRVFTSWSGGKDSCLACYKAIESGLEVCYLLNMVTEDGKKAWTHGQTAEVLLKQSQALGIPLVQGRATGATYEAEFKNTLITLKREKVEGGVFGDIDFELHRRWIEGVCGAADIKPYLPLWGQSQEALLRSFIDLGFEAVVVVVRSDLLGEEWLGRRVDLEFLSYLQANNISPCGEDGEYHTFVIDGPLFKQRVEILETRKVLKDGRWFLEILNCELRDK